MGPIIAAVLRRYELKHEVLVAPGKARRAVTEARAVCSWLARQLELPMSDTEIASALHKGAATVSKGARRVARQRNRDRWLRETTDELLQELRS